MATHPGFSRFHDFDMASNTQPSQGKGRMHLPPPANYLLSPPEESALDSFSADVSPSPTQQTWSNKLPPIQLGPSPPTSPQISPLPRLPSMREKRQAVRSVEDPPLFARSGLAISSSAPLFDSDHSLQDGRRDSGPGTLSPTFEGPKVSHTKAQYARPSLFRFIANSTLEEIEEFRQRNLDDLLAHRQARREAQEPEVSSQLNEGLAKYSEKQKSSILKANTCFRVCKPQSRPIPKRQVSPPAAQSNKPVRIPKPTPKTLTAPRRTPKTSAAPKAIAVARSTKSLSVDPQQPRKRAPASKAGVPKSEDQNWATQPDFCPPTSTLIEGKTLRVTWKSPPNDLSQDPVAQQMHPQEFDIACALKLPGLQYMANKRRIFAARLQCLKDDTAWGKTKAQNATNIDVNKTSQMFEAFDRVGWFERKHFEKWLS